MNEISTRGKVTALQAEMAKLPQLELETEHHFADGMYARVVRRPKGAVIVGKVHRREHFYIVTKGAVRVSDGETWRDYHAGDVIVSQPGTKRAVFALEDSICMTVHRTNKRNLEKIERELIVDDPTSPFGPGNKLRRLACPS
jgi:quercetin dioxygenase-like cupin family protein